MSWLDAGKRGRRNSVGSLDSTMEVSLSGAEVCIFSFRPKKNPSLKWPPHSPRMSALRTPPWKKKKTCGSCVSIPPKPWVIILHLCISYLCARWYAPCSCIRMMIYYTLAWKKMKRHQPSNLWLSEPLHIGPCCCHCICDGVCFVCGLPAWIGMRSSWCIIGFYSVWSRICIWLCFKIFIVLRFDTEVKLFHDSNQLTHFPSPVLLNCHTLYPFVILFLPYFPYTSWYYCSRSFCYYPWFLSVCTCTSFCVLCFLTLPSSPLCLLLLLSCRLLLLSPHSLCLRVPSLAVHSLTSVTQ